MTRVVVGDRVRTAAGLGMVGATPLGSISGTVSSVSDVDQSALVEFDDGVKLWLDWRDLRPVGRS